MKKKELIEKLRALPFDPRDYWVVAGGAMVLHGIREETADIDLGCTSRMADRLEAEGYPRQVTPDGNRRFKARGDLEVFENWLYDTVVQVDGIPVISIPGLIQMKQLLGREKDKRDIALIHEYLERAASGSQHPR